MKTAHPLRFSLVLVFALFIIANIGATQDFTSCREKARGCFALTDGAKKDCIVNIVNDRECSEWNATVILAERIGKAFNAVGKETPIVDEKCLALADGQISASLSKESLSTKDIEMLSSAIQNCKKKITNEFLNP